ncbi:MAG: hypothetical protein WKH64_14520 [Chloroflexia bacterium]
MTEQNATPEQTWQSALEWFQNLKMGRRKVELTAIIRPIYVSLGQAPDVQALRSLYLDPADAETALELAKRSYPDNKQLWNLSRTRDVAYGLRLAELRSKAERAE